MRLRVLIDWCLICAAAFSVDGVAADSLHPQELLPVRHGKSSHALRELVQLQTAIAIPVHPHEAEPIRVNPHPQATAAPLATDSLQGQVVTDPLPLTRFVSWEGLGAGRAKDGFTMEMAPPDTNGAVGETQFVQWVNTSVGVFDKKSGSLTGPFRGNLVWAGFGGNCEEHNNGDPIVQYDKMAKRWFLAQFSVTGGTSTGYSECIALSESSDATGYYWLYEFEYPALADYPKVAVWPDGYYVSFNMYQEYVDSSGNTVSNFLGARACVYDRAAMLAGRLGRQECFQLSDQYFGLLPSDLDGARRPKAGTPNFYIALGTQPNTLDVWKFAVNWAKPSESRFGIGLQNQPNTTISVAPYGWACNGTGLTCIPQRRVKTGQEQLDSLGDRLMYRASYRQFPNHDSMIVDHSVDTGGSAPRTGVRWYEFRGLDKKMPTVFQQGTYAPDANHRWIASAAMDKSGNMVIGYNVSGDAVAPSIRMSGRMAKDAPGVLRKEADIEVGTGIQTCLPPSGGCQCQNQDGTCGKLTRWGDYSDLTLDPTDDCTFWYTSEYQAEDGAFNWHTRIDSVSLDSCRHSQTPSR